MKTPHSPSLGGIKKGSSDDKLDRLLHVLNRSYLTIEHAKEVKDILKTANKQWLIQFLKANGLHLLSSQLVNFHTNPDALAGGTAIQYELLLAVKSAMNSQVGLDIMTRESDLVSSLALNIDCFDSVICTQTLELLSVLMVSGEGGSKAVLDSLDFFKLVKRERVRFQSLVDALQSPHSPISFKRDILFFLNTVVNTSIVLEDRLEIRADLVYAGILPTVEKLKLLCFDELVQDVSDQYSSDVAKRVEELHELESQLQVFETVLQRDVSECITDLENTFDSTEVDLSDPEQIFQSLHASTVEHECFFPFLSVLQTLLMIPSYDVFGKKQWSLVDNSIKSIIRSTMCEDGSGAETSGSLLVDSKESLSWKQRVEELSQQVDALGKRCQTLEEEETVLKDELQELRSREASLQFLREGDSTRHSQEGDLRRRREAEILRHAEDIVSKASSGGGFGGAAGSIGSSNGNEVLTEGMGGDLGSKISQGLVTRVEVQAHASELEKQLQQMHALLNAEFDGPSALAEYLTQTESAPTSTPSVRLAVSSSRPVPCPPPLPAVFVLSHEPLPENRSYNQQCAPPLPSADASSSAGGPLNSQAMLNKPAKQVIEPSVPMRSLFWTRVPDSSIRKTIWQHLSDENVTLNIVKLEQQFCKTLHCANPEDEEEQKELKMGKKEKQKDISLLDSKVQQNVGIALAKFRMPSHEICRAIIQMDFARLDLEKLMSLRALAPSPDDISVLKEYDGDVEKLGKVEKFFLHINNIPRYIPRLDCFVFMCKFQMLVSEMYQQYDVMNRALDQLETSKSFRRILEIVLALGNYLNGSTPRGGYYGFKLEGLLKLPAVKSVDNKLNLMHFLVKQCKSVDEKLLSVIDELSMMEEASRISLEGCKAEISTLRNNLTTVEDAIEAQRLDPEPDENDRLIEVLSPFKLEAGSEIEKLEDEFKSISQRFYKTLTLFGGDKDQHTFTGFFSLVKDFIHSFSKAHRDIEKRRVLKDKQERKRIAEEKAKKARREKKSGISDAETLIDDVFFALKDKKADEIIDSLKSTAPQSRRPKNSKRRIGARPRRKVGAAEEFNADDDDVLAAMMLKLGVESKPSKGKVVNKNDPVEPLSTSGVSNNTTVHSPKPLPKAVRDLSVNTSSPKRKGATPPGSGSPVPGRTTMSGTGSPVPGRTKQGVSTRPSFQGSPKIVQRTAGSGNVNSPIRRNKKEVASSPGGEDDELLTFLNRKKASK